MNQASLEPEARHWKRRFDVDVAADSPGPGPGLILEALTAARTAEGFDLERLETIGDSLLKLAVSVYVYGHSAAGSARAADEGLLSLMRSRQISNRNLYRLGRHLELATVMAAKPFDLKVSARLSLFRQVAPYWLQVCFEPWLLIGCFTVFTGFYLVLHIFTGFYLVY